MAQRKRFNIMAGVILLIIVVAFFSIKKSVDTTPVMKTGNLSPVVQVVAVSSSDKFENGVIPSSKINATLSGSGFIVRKDGLVVTNKHLIPTAGTKLSVILSNGERHEATLIREHPTLDIAILRVDGVKEDLPIAIPKDSENLKIGDSVTAVSFEDKSQGILTSKNREIEVEAKGGITKMSGLLETTAKTEAGFSGGPLLNTQGEVIGINLAYSADNQEKSVAIPMASVIDFIAEASLND